MKKINPLWIIWLILNTTFAVMGGAVIGNQLNILVIPYIVAVFNFLFVIYYYYLFTKETSHSKTTKGTTFCS